MKRYYYSFYNYMNGRSYEQIIYQKDTTIDIFYSIYLKHNYYNVEDGINDNKWYKTNGGNANRVNSNFLQIMLKNNKDKDKWKEYDTMEEVLIDFPELMLL